MGTPGVHESRANHPWIQSNLARLLPHVLIGVNRRLTLARRCRFRLVHAHPILLKAAWYLAPTWGARVPPLSPAWFGRSVFRSEVGGTLVWGCPCWDVTFIHSTFVIQHLFSVSQRPSLSCYVGGFAAIWQHHILRILGCIFVFYETTNQIFKFICPFGQICKVIRMHYVNNAEKQYFTWHG
jgi:hypothetical protein